MNKAQLVASIVKATKTPAAQVEKVLEVTFSTIKATVKKGNDVKLVGFGTFTKAKRKARVGRHPQTGVTIKIPAKWTPKFRAGAEFKSVVK